MWGPFMVLGSFSVQRATLAGCLPALLLAVIQGLWVALVLLVNNIRDVEADAAMGIRTPATLLGKGPAVVLAAILITGAYLLDAAAILLRVLSAGALVAFVSAPLAVLLFRSFATRRGVAANAPATAARTAMVFGLLLVVSLVAGGTGA